MSLPIVTQTAAIARENISLVKRDTYADQRDIYGMPKEGSRKVPRVKVYFIQSTYDYKSIELVDEDARSFWHQYTGQEWILDSPSWGVIPKGEVTWKSC